MDDGKTRNVEVSIDTSDGFLAIIVGWPIGHLDRIVNELAHILWRKYNEHLSLHMRELSPDEKSRVVRTFIEVIGDKATGPEPYIIIRCFFVGRKIDNIQRGLKRAIEAITNKWRIHAIYADRFLRELFPPPFPRHIIKEGRAVVLADIVAWLNMAYERGRPRDRVLIRFRRVEDFIRTVLYER